MHARAPAGPNEALNKANTLLQAHLDEALPRNCEHIDETISRIDEVMSAVGGPHVFFNTQVHGQTYYDVLESPLVSAKRLCKLQCIAMPWSLRQSQSNACNKSNGLHQSPNRMCQQCSTCSAC